MTLRQIRQVRLHPFVFFFVVLLVSFTMCNIGLQFAEKKSIPSPAHLRPERQNSKFFFTNQ